MGGLISKVEHVRSLGFPPQRFQRCAATILVLCLTSASAGTSVAISPVGKALITKGSATYRVEDLGELAPIAGDATVSLGRAGTVAFWTKTNGAVHAAVWSHGKTTTVESVPGYPNTIAHAVNQKGAIAGWMNTTGNLVDSLSTTRGFVRDGRHLRVVATLGGRDSRVFGLNDKGVAVGEASLANGATHAFLVAGSSIADLGTLPLGSSSTAFAINNAGLIAGAADIDGKVKHAVLWTNRKIVDLGALPHGLVSSARAMNDHGQIVGFSDTPGGVHAFIYFQGTMRDLGTLGSDPSEASGINNRGDVVGASNLSGSRRRAFLWREGQMTDLNSSLPLGSPWVLLNAFSINDQGQIVCSGRRKGESNHLLLLTPRMTISAIIDIPGGSTRCADSLFSPALLVAGLPLEMAGFFKGPLTGYMWIAALVLELALGPWLIIKGGAKCRAALKPRILVLTESLRQFKPGQGQGKGS